MLVDGSKLRQIFNQVVSPEMVFEAVERLRIQDRERKLDVAGLVASLLLSGGNHRFGTQSAVLQQYQALGYLKVSRGAFYKWFTDGLATMMEEIGASACHWVDTRPKHLPDILSGRTDLRDTPAAALARSPWGGSRRPKIREREPSRARGLNVAPWG